MSYVMPSYKRLYLCVVLAFAIGASCALTKRIDLLLLSAASISLLEFVAGKHRLSQTISSWWRRCPVILLALFISFGYTNWRVAIITPEPLLKYAGHSAIFVGELLEKLPSNSPEYDNYSLLIKKMMFPQSRWLKLKTHLTVKRRLSLSTGEAKPALNKLQMFRVTIRADKEPGRDEFKADNGKQNNKATVAVGNEHAFLACTESDITSYQSPLTESPESLAQRLSSSLQSAIEIARRGVVAAHVAALSNERGCLLASMVLGDKAIRLPEKVTQTFRLIGLSHILAASGFNLTLVITASFFISASLPLTEKQRALFTLFILTGFVLLAGFSASIVRAAIMCFILVASRLTRRKSQIMPTIATALLLTIIFEPRALLDLGLQLSYSATIGITCGARPLAELMQISPSRFGRIAGETVSTCLMAQLSVLPLQVYSFWNANVLFLLANVMVLPLVGPITIVGFASSVTALVSVLCPPAQGLTQATCNSIDSLVAMPLTYIMWLSNYLASLSWAHLRAGKPDLAQVAFYYLCYLAFLFALQKHWPRIIIIGLPVIATTVLLMRPVPADLTIGALRSGLVLINCDRDAAVILKNQSEDTKIADRALDKFLNYAAVRDSTILNSETVEQSVGSIRLAKLSHHCAIYLDSNRNVGAVFVPSADALTYALGASTESLAKLRASDERLLLLRMDNEQKDSNKQTPEKIWRGMSQIMQACGLDTAMIIFSSRQYTRFAPIINHICSDSTLERHTTAIVSDKALAVITLTRKQLASGAISDFR